MGGWGDTVSRYGELDGDGRTELLDRLAADAAGGDLDALDGLLAVIDGHRLTRSAIRRLIVNEGDADDVHQDVMIRVAERVGSFNGASRFTTWLHTVSRNTAIDHLRARRPADAMGDDEPVSEARRVSSLISSRADINAALASLPDHYRDVVLLRDVEGHSYDAIATRLDLPINTVRSRLARGRAMAARLLHRS